MTFSPPLPADHHVCRERHIVVNSGRRFSARGVQKIRVNKLRSPGNPLWPSLSLQPPFCTIVSSPSPVSLGLPNDRPTHTLLHPGASKTAAARSFHHHERSDSADVYVCCRVVQRYGAVGGNVQPLRRETIGSSAVWSLAVPVSSGGATPPTRRTELRVYSVLHPTSLSHTQSVACVLVLRRGLPACGTKKQNE